jgi:hypothetical protein
MMMIELNVAGSWRLNNASGARIGRFGRTRL